MCEHDIPMGGCYHSGVAWGIGYYTDDQCVELHDKIFTTLDSGHDGGVAAELKKLRDNFDPSRDVPKFAVALRPVLIVEPDDDGEDACNAGCDLCGYDYRVDGEAWCEACLEDNCYECEQPWDDCTCNEDADDDCIHCGLDPETCGCWDESDDEDDGDNDDYCPDCGNYQYCDCDELDEEFVADTFRPMNAFARARWLKARGEL